MSKPVSNQCGRHLGARVRPLSIRYEKGHNIAQVALPYILTALAVRISFGLRHVQGLAKLSFGQSDRKLPIGISMYVPE